MFIKICSNCNKNFTVLKIEDFKKYFHKAKLGKFGFHARCKTCRHTIEIIPNREKRAEYDRKRYKNKSIITWCIVCNKEFKAQREGIKCCSKECSKKKKKVQNRIFKNANKERYKQEREKEFIRENRRKVYTQDEIKYILSHLHFGARKLAKKLGRTTNGMNKFIHKLKTEKMKRI